MGLGGKRSGGGGHAGFLPPPPPPPSHCHRANELQAARSSPRSRTQHLKPPSEQIKSPPPEGDTGAFLSPVSHNPLRRPFPIKVSKSHYRHSRSLLLPAQLPGPFSPRGSNPPVGENASSYLRPARVPSTGAGDHVRHRPAVVLVLAYAGRADEWPSI